MSPTIPDTTSTRGPGRTALFEYAENSFARPARSVRAAYPSLTSSGSDPHPASVVARPAQARNTVALRAQARNTVALRAQAGNTVALRAQTRIAVVQRAGGWNAVQFARPMGEVTFRTEL